MQVNLSPTQQQRLSLHASAAGYQDVESFVAAQLADIAEQPTSEELPKIDAASAREMIRQGERDLVDGNVQDMQQALSDMGRRRGYKRDA